MVKDLIRYDLLVQDALKGVVRKVLSDAVRNGLPGEHHFYVSFHTGHPGVHLSNRLREKYPQEMTIVVQHQFWDLHVGENAFEIGLSFSNIPERLHIPFDALTGFFDPSVQFGLKFNSADEEGKTAEPVVLDNEFSRKAKKAKAREAERSDKETIVTAATPTPEKPEEKVAPAEKAPKKPSEKAKRSEEKRDKEHSGAEVVSLDAFRKK